MAKKTVKRKAKAAKKQAAKRIPNKKVLIKERKQEKERKQDTKPEKKKKVTIPAKKPEVKQPPREKGTHKKSRMAFIVLFLVFAAIFGFALFNEFYMTAVEFGIYVNGIPLNMVIIYASLFLMLFSLLIYIRARRGPKPKKAPVTKKERMPLVRDLSKVARVEIGQNETDFDALYKLVQQRERIKLGALAKYFKVSKKQVEDWATILKEHGLIDIDYPAFGDPRIIKLEEKR
jgi:hypothetical protein